MHNAHPNCEAPTGGKELFQIYLSTILYPFHLVSDFGTEFILEPKMAFVNKPTTNHLDSITQFDKKDSLRCFIVEFDKNPTLKQQKNSSTKMLSTIITPQ